jgi:hypothetical protein
MTVSRDDMTDASADTNGRAPRRPGPRSGGGDSSRPATRSPSSFSTDWRPCPGTPPACLIPAT